MEPFTKGIEIGYGREDKPASGYVVHTRELHFRIPFQFSENCPLSLMSLRYNYLCPAGPGTEYCLERVEHGAMGRAPSINDLIIFRRSGVFADPIARPAHSFL
jgi:hypothetical protein